MSQIIFVRNKAQAASPVFPGEGGGGLRGQPRPCTEGRSCFPGQLPWRNPTALVFLWEQGSDVAFLALRRASPFVLVPLLFPFRKKKKVTLVGAGAHTKSTNSVLNGEPTAPST